MAKHHKAERQTWVLGWFSGKHAPAGTSNYCADSLNEHFHEAYHLAFPEYIRKETAWGAQPVAQAMRDMADLAGDGILTRGRIGLGGGNWQPGFPKWVWSYSLASQGEIDYDAER